MFVTGDLPGSGGNVYLIINTIQNLPVTTSLHRRKLNQFKTCAFTKATFFNTCKANVHLVQGIQVTLKYLNRKWVYLQRFQSIRWPEMTVQQEHGGEATAGDLSKRGWRWERTFPQFVQNQLVFVSVCSCGCCFELSKAHNVKLLGWAASALLTC